MSRVILVVAGAASVATATSGIYSVAGSTAAERQERRIISETDFGQVRRTTMTAHPIGSKVEDVAKAMTGAGFRCEFRPHLIENITAPTVVCNSNGHGTAGQSRLVVVIIARNGQLTDVAVSNGLDPVEANALTPDPNPGGGVPAAPPMRKEADPEWDRIVNAAARRYPRKPTYD
jgi:hypothetical protein